MSINDVLRVFQRFWALIIIITAVGVSAAAVTLLLLPPTYTSTARLFVSTQSLGTAQELLQGSTYTQARMLSYAEVASDPIVLDPVIDQLGLDTTAADLADRVSATTETDSLIIEITADDRTADGAADTVNAVASELSRVITQRIEAPVAGSDPLVTVTLVKQATPSAEPSWPVLWIFLTVGGVAGLLVGVGLAFLLNALDTRVRNADQVRTLTGLPLVGTVMKDRRLTRASVLEEMRSSSQFAEAIRTIRTNLRFVDVDGDPRRVLLVASSVPGEGKSTIALGLALSLAESGERVAIVDGDLRAPRLARMLGLEGGVGMTDVLLGRVDLATALQPAGPDGALGVLVAGRTPPNPAELLGSAQFATILRDLRARYDYVIIDSPPVLAVTDAVVLSRVVDGVLLVVGVERVRRAQLEASSLALRQVGAPLIGVIANRLARSGVDAYSYYAYGYFGADDDSDDSTDHDARDTRDADDDPPLRLPAASGVPGPRRTGEAGADPFAELLGSAGGSSSGPRPRSRVEQRSLRRGDA